MCVLWVAEIKYVYVCIATPQQELYAIWYHGVTFHPAEVTFPPIPGYSLSAVLVTTAGHVTRHQIRQLERML